MDRLFDWFDRQSQKKLDPPAMILGEKGESPEDVNALIVPLPLWTYRCDYPAPLPRSRLLTDKGWGCLIRTSQMMLSRTLLRHGAFHVEDFRDSPEAPFSIHQFVGAVAEPNREFEPKFWSPSQGCEAIRKVTSRAERLSAKDKRLTVYVAENGCLYNDELLYMLSRAAVLLLLPVRPTASERITQPVYQVLEHLLASPHCVGIVGGVPRRSYYFVGTTTATQRLIFLDPHVQTQPAFVDLRTLGHSCEGVETIGCVDWKRIDSSLLVGVYLRSAADLNDFSLHMDALWRCDTESVFITLAPSRSTVTAAKVQAVVDDVEAF